MNAPTLYFLTVYERITGGYEVWEQHMCQEKGCIKTQPEFVEYVSTAEEAKAIIAEFGSHYKVEDVDWIELPKLPTIHEDDVTDDFCGTYADYPEMILAMCELSGLKAYRVMSDDGRLLRFTFEVEE